MQTLDKWETKQCNNGATSPVRSACSAQDGNIPGPDWQSPAYFPADISAIVLNINFPNAEHRKVLLRINLHAGAVE